MLAKRLLHHLPLNLFPRLAELQVPTLVMSGAADTLVPPAESERAAAAIDGATYEVFADCGHALQEECPQRFLGVVTPWLNAFQGNSVAN